MNLFIETRNDIFKNYLNYWYTSPSLNIYFQYTLQVFSAVRNFSYIFQTNHLSYTYVIAIIARPQIIIQIDNFHYAILTIIILYMTASQIKNQYTYQLNIFGKLLNLGLINLFFEFSQGPLDYLVYFLLTFIILIDNFIVSETLTFEKHQIFTQKKSLFELFLISMNIIVMYLNKYTLNQTLIQIFSIINSVLCLVYYMTQFPIKKFIVIWILCCIHIITCYLGVIYLIFGNHNFITDFMFCTLIIKIMQSYFLNLLKYQPIKLNDLLYTLYQQKILKQIHIDKPQQQKKDLIIYASILAYQNKYYQALMILHTIKQLDWITNLKKELLTKDWLTKLDLMLRERNHTQTGLAEVVQQLTKIEDENVFIQTKIINIIKRKRELQTIIYEKSNITFYDFLNFTQQCIQLKNSLENQYQNFPNQKTKNILSFLYSEILNEFLLAHNLQMHMIKSDDTKQNIQLFTQKMIYLISIYNTDIIIKRASNNAEALFKINHHKLIGENINILIPPGIREQHHKLIQSFLLNGQSKYMRKLGKNYCYNNHKKLAQQIDFALDISFIHDDINFITFIQPIHDQPMFIILNDQNIISTMNDTFLLYLNVQGQQFRNQLVSKFIPCLSNGIKQEYYENVELIVNIEKDESNHQGELVNYTSSTLGTFQTSFSIEIKYLESKPLFSLLIFDYFKKTENSMKYTNTETQSAIKGTISYQENIFIDEPYDYEEEEKQFVLFKQTTELLINDISFNQIQTKDQQLSSRPFFYNTVKKIEESISDDEIDPNNQQSNAESEAEQEQENSYLSSMRELRGSIFYKKYEIFEKLSNSNKTTKNQRIFLYFLSICLLIQLILIIVQLIVSQQNLTNLVDDIDLLQIKNFAFQPFESFLVTRWTIFNYNTLLSLGQISQDDYNELIIFPKSNLALGFDRLRSNIDQVLNKAKLQSFLENTYLDIYLYTATNTGELYNISLRNCIEQLLNYQYITKMAYALDKNVVVDSPNIYFQYRNYYIIKQTFGQINQDLLSNTIYRASLIFEKIQVIYIFALLFLTTSLFFSYLIYLKIEQSHQKFISLVLCSQSEYLHKDVLRLTLLQNLIMSDYNNLFQYQFQLNNKEEQFDKIKQRLDNTEHRKYIFEVHFEKSTKNIWIRIFLIIILLTIITQASVSFGQVNKYLSQYPDTAKFYKGLSDIGTDIPCVFAQSNILYGRANFPYLNSSDIERIYEEITTAINEITQFTQTNIDFSLYFLSLNYQNYYNYIMSNNLCDQLLDDMKTKASYICPLVMNGDMERGMSVLLTYIVNYINTEEDINQFTQRLSLSYLELEGAFLASEIIRKLNIDLYNDLINQTNIKVNQIIIHSIIIMIIGILYILFLIFIIKNKLLNQEFIVQRFIYLVPLNTLLFDDAFERNAKTLILRQNL